MTLILSAACNLCVDLSEKLSLLFQSFQILNVLLGTVHVGKAFIFTPTTTVNSFVASVLCSVILIVIIQQEVVLLIIFHHEH